MSFIARNGALLSVISDRNQYVDTELQWFDFYTPLRKIPVFIPPRDFVTHSVIISNPDVEYIEFKSNIIGFATLEPIPEGLPKVLI